LEDFEIARSTLTTPNTYQARAVNRQKVCEPEFFLFRLSSAERELRLDLPSQGRHQLGAPEMLFASRIVV
jgi:hypothetical protein